MTVMRADPRLEPGGGAHIGHQVLRRNAVLTPSIATGPHRASPSG